jgi:hypothetical protein
VRSRRYLNNIIEQDHRAIKRRCAPMLALKSFRSAAITLAGVELAHRIRKRQFSFGRAGPHQFSSLKHLWARALVRQDFATYRNQGKCRNAYPLLHQNSGARMLTEAEVQAIKPLRHFRKISDSGGLHLLVTPKGSCCWRFAYRYGQKYKALALGVYPDVSLERARSSHEFARHLLAHGLDPSALKAALGKYTFAATLREWEKARGGTSAPSRRGYE